MIARARAANCELFHKTKSARECVGPFLIGRKRKSKSFASTQIHAHAQREREKKTTNETEKKTRKITI